MRDNRETAGRSTGPLSRLRRIAAAAFVAGLAVTFTAGGAASVFAGVNTNYTGVNPDVSRKARSKFTKLKGKGRDDVTIMIYMIGSNLESDNGMATSDINEMLYSGIDNDRVNVFVETGGCKRWRNSVISPGKTERWKLTAKGLSLLDSKKAQSMTSPSCLSDFIRYCSEEAPADRYILIFWDHGGGSVSGYGYDELYPNETMDIGEISRALRDGGVKFDFVGFDTCLMATLENAIAVEPYADYLIASEESEPGTGWYYTNWFKLLDDNSSTNTLGLGRQIIDDFTAASMKISPGSVTTLSLIDLAELKGTVLPELGDFGSELMTQLKSEKYQNVAIARNGTREFAQSQKLDQADLVDFCTRLGTKEAGELSKAIQNAVKYNRVNQISDAYGLSIYFPNSSLKSINSMLRLYEDIGMDENWSDSVRAYATLESSGQIAASSGAAYGGGSGSLIDLLLGNLGGNTGTVSPQVQNYGYGSLFGGNSYDSYGSMGVEDLYSMLTGGSSYYTGQQGYSQSQNYGYSSDVYDQLLSQLTGGYTTTSGANYGGLDLSSLLGGYTGSSYGYDSYANSAYNSNYGSSTGSTAGDLLSMAASMLFRNPPVGAETLTLSEKDGEQVLVLSEDRWEQITDAELNVFVDDGDGFLDLGLDNVAEYNDDGDLIDAWDGTWLTLEGQPVAVYPISDEDEDDNGLYITRKFIPALLNGERVNLIAEFNEETGEDKILGAEAITDTGMVGRGYTEMNGGDTITLVCDYYDYNGVFSAQYTLGEPVTVPEDGILTLANMEIAGGEDDRMLYTYRLTDIYQANYWLPMTEA